MLVAVLHHYHPNQLRKRANVLIFVVGGCSPPPPTTNIENEQTRSFSLLVAVLHHHHLPPMSKMSVFARFRRWWLSCITTSYHQL
jgi:hypothetical protein